MDGIGQYFLFERSHMGAGFSSWGRLVLTMKANNGTAFCPNHYSHEGVDDKILSYGESFLHMPRYWFDVSLYDINDVKIESFNMVFGITNDMYDEWFDGSKDFASCILASPCSDNAREIINYIKSKRGYVEISGLYDLITSDRMITTNLRFSIKVPCMGNNKPAPKTNTTKKSNKRKRK
jgi:hypothetical protein